MKISFCNHIVTSLLYFLTINVLLVEISGSNKTHMTEDHQVLRAGFAQLPGARKICITKDCAFIGSTIASNIDISIDPCENFYEHACGNYKKRTVIQENKIFKNIFSDVDDELLNRLRILLQDDPEKHFIIAERLPIQFYAACMNTSAIEERGIQPLMNQLEYLGGWPLLKGDDWTGDYFSWENTILLLRRAGLHYDSLFNLYIGPDMAISKHKVIYVDQPTFGLERAHLIKGLGEKHVHTYVKYIYDVALLLGANKERAAQEIVQVVNFEIELAKIAPTGHHRRHMNDNVYNPMIISQLQNAYPSMPWILIFNGILHPYHVVVPEDEFVNIQIPIFLSQLASLLEVTPKRVLANYMIWRVVQSLVPFLPESLRDQDRLYNQKVTGRKDINPRWMECVQSVRKGFPHAMGAMYVRNYFVREAKILAVDLFEKIRGEFLKILRSADWMDGTTKYLAMDKVESISGENIGYPDIILDVEKLDAYYSSLSVNENFGYIDYVLALKLFSDNEEMKNLRKIVNKSEFSDMGEVADINAYYSIAHNYLHIPAGLLQGLFFSIDHVDFVNYATTGFIMAHEMVHAIDEWGRHVNKHGVKGDWWGEKTALQYKMKSECFVKQYSSYEVEQVGNIDGARTLVENIADSVAMKIITNAYFKNDTNSETRLPGIANYGFNSSFWISAASVWCSNDGLEYSKMAVTSDYRPIQKYRVIGSISNSEYFSNAFQCRPESKMNSQTKCEVW